MQARLVGIADSAGAGATLPFPSPPSCGPHSLHHRVPTGCEVIFVAINEGHPEVEEQVDEKGPSVLSQEDLGMPRDKVRSHPGRLKAETRGGVRAHRHPADLGSQVPEEECGCGAHRKLLQDIFIFQRLSLYRNESVFRGCPGVWTPGAQGKGWWTAVLTGVQAEGLSGRVPLRVC